MLANSSNFLEKHVILEQCKGVHCVDLGESFPISLQIAKIGFDTAENEPSEVCPMSVYRSSRYIFIDRVENTFVLSSVRVQSQEVVLDKVTHYSFSITSREVECVGGVRRCRNGTRWRGEDGEGRRES